VQRNPCYITKLLTQHYLSVNKHKQPVWYADSRRTKNFI